MPPRKRNSTAKPKAEPTEPEKHSSSDILSIAEASDSAVPDSNEADTISVAAAKDQQASSDADTTLIDDTTTANPKRPSKTLINKDELVQNMTGMPGEFAGLDAEKIVKTQILKKLLDETRKFKQMFLEFNTLLAQNPQRPEPTTDEGRKQEEEIQATINKARNRLLAQTTICKTLNRKAVMQTREDKQKTGEMKQEVDKLHLGLQNLRYEQQSLERETAAAKNHEHPYQKLDLLPLDQFLETFPEYQDKPESEVMPARIEHEYSERVALEEKRQQKIKEKQSVATVVKDRKEDLGKLDASLEKFIEAAEPIQKTLAKE